MKDLLIGRTYYPGHYEILESKYSRLENCLKRMASIIKSDSTGLQGILLAPEYFFTLKNEEGNINYAMSEINKRTVEQKLVDMSK